MNNYTKGEWKVSGTGMHVVVGTGFSLEVIASCSNSEEGKANAHLIAVSPRMIKVLEMILNFTRGYTEMPKDRIEEVIIQVLAKVEMK